jgi:hypothetical protein
MATATEFCTLEYAMNQYLTENDYGVPCYNHITPCDGNTHLFPKEQTRGSTSTKGENTQGRSIIKQVPSKSQNNLLPRQWNNESWRQAQIPKKWEVQRPTEGGARSENRQALMTADQHQTAEKAAARQSTAETRTHITTTRPRAVEPCPQHTMTRPAGRQSRPQYTTARPTMGKSCPR